MPNRDSGSYIIVGDASLSCPPLINCEMHLKSVPNWHNYSLYNNAKRGQWFLYHSGECILYHSREGAGLSPIGIIILYKIMPNGDIYHSGGCFLYHSRGELGCVWAAH